ncbi:MAG TPA: NfeD family protein [Candidatus Dormibacteraeota bacterium]|nr:NfeD family protein [Candidatus Dormibacteraeota bacterium]
MFWIAWLVAALLLLAIEAHTTAFYALFLAAGAFAGAIVSAVGLPEWLAAIAFAVVAAAGTSLVRPTLKASWDRHQGPRLTMPGQSDALVGQRALTIDQVGDEHHPGHARLAGEAWLAVTDEPGGVRPDTSVLVIEVRGTTLVVMPVGGN